MKLVCRRGRKSEILLLSNSLTFARWPAVTLRTNAQLRMYTKQARVPVKTIGRVVFVKRRNVCDNTVTVSYRRYVTVPVLGFALGTQRSRLFTNLRARLLFAYRESIVDYYAHINSFYYT